MIDYKKLIDEQIEYWTKLKLEHEGFLKCEHEPDSQKHLFSDEGGNFFMNKCKKCGEFYR